MPAQAASIRDHDRQHYSETVRNLGSRLAQQLHAFRPLQRWLCRHGRGLLQLQSSTAFNAEVKPSMTVKLQQFL